MHPQDVEDRLRAVLKELEGRRQGAKKALDEAWAKDPKAVDGLLSGLREAHSKYLEFSEVSERALPLLQTLSRIAQLRQEAIDHLDRLANQAEESRKLKDSLRPEELQTMEQVPPLVGETFDLSLLAEEQVRMIQEARAALAASGAPGSARPASKPRAADPGPAGGAAGPEGSAAPSEAATTNHDAPPNPDTTLDVTLEEWAAGQGEGDAAAVESLPGDEALDAMFEEAVTSEPEGDGVQQEPTEEGPGAPEEPLPSTASDHAAPADEATPPPAPAASASPSPAPAEPEGSASGVDPLDELLTRAGFE